ncbi:MAG: hypothetical protein QOF68_1899 [Gaiellales bacterium]|nr:hypothetical protein [Gaiellales bacterium]
MLSRSRDRFLVLLAVLVVCLAAAASASADVVINEIESDDIAVPDYVELTNNGVAPVDISGYVIKDSNDGNAFSIPAATTLAPGGYYLAGTLGFGLGAGDSARLFAAGDLVNPIDSYSWVSHAAATYGRCPDGTGAITATSSSTPGATNDCPVAALAWPGGTAVSFADDTNVFGPNLSGLAYQPSGSSTRGVLWAVRNGPSTLFRLVFDGTKWTPDSTNGWSAGKQLFFTNGSGVPDAEGVTLAGGDANGIFASIERNDDGANSNTSRPAILRYDVSGASATLTATREWDVTADLPGLGANAGLEAIAWVPDSLLVAKGFKDEATNATYAPATYPDHGSGLFFVGIEQDGRIIAYALNQSAGTFTRVAAIASGFPKVMDLEYEPETTHLWAVCDDSCTGRVATLDIAQSGGNAGKFVVSGTYDRPAGMANLNNEGFAIAPQEECVNSLKPVFWADDSSTDSHALRSGTIGCTVLPAPPGESPPPGGDQPPGAVPPQPSIGGQLPGLKPDITAPALRIALKFAKRGAFAVRRTGKFGVKITLGERANLTITATARKNKRAKARTILRATRKSVAAGTRTLTFTLSRKVRKALAKGETVKLTVKAIDAARNARTRSISARVP